MKLIATHILIFCIDVVVMGHRGSGERWNGLFIYLFIFKKRDKMCFKNILT